MYQLVAAVCSVNVFDNGEFFSPEHLDMRMLYGVADGNARLTCELLIERFPNRAIPCAQTFTSAVEHFRDHGTFKPKTHDRSRDMIQEYCKGKQERKNNSNTA